MNTVDRYKKCRFYLFVFIWVGTVLCLAMQPASADGKALKTNRLMLARFKGDYAKLMEQQILHPTSYRERQLTNLNIKIKALNDDIERLLAPPSEKEARSFLRELLSKETPVSKGAPVFINKTAIAESTIKLHEKALECVSNNNLAEAIKLYEEILLVDPNDDQAYLLMGHCFLLSGDYEKSESAFYHATTIDPQNRDEIIPFYQNTVLQYPEDDSAHADLGYAWLILGDYLKAKEAFNDALQINPDSEKAARGLAIIKAQGN